MSILDKEDIMYKLSIAGIPTSVQRWKSDHIYKTIASAKRRARQIMKADASIYSIWILDA
jgi:hypothetical protein